VLAYTVGGSADVVYGGLAAGYRAARPGCGGYDSGRRSIAEQGLLMTRAQNHGAYQCDPGYLRFTPTRSSFRSPRLRRTTTLCPPNAECSAGGSSSAAMACRLVTLWTDGITRRGSVLISCRSRTPRLPVAADAGPRFRKVRSWSARGPRRVVRLTALAYHDRGGPRSR
jgi:hypothetical protein